MSHRDEVRHLILAVSIFCDDIFVREVVGLAIFLVQRAQLFEFFRVLKGVMVVELLSRWEKPFGGFSFEAEVKSSVLAVSSKEFSERISSKSTYSKLHLMQSGNTEMSLPSYSASYTNLALIILSSSFKSLKHVIQYLSSDGSTIGWVLTSSRAASSPTFSLSSLYRCSNSFSFRLRI